MNNILVYLLAAWIAIAVIRAIAGIIYTSLDHWGWSKDAEPDENAVIVSVKSEFVNQKAFSKFKTTVNFSDGFWFLTHPTNRKTKFARYEFSVDRDLLEPELAKAVRIHQREAAERIKKEGRKHAARPTEGTSTPSDFSGENIPSEKREVSDIRL